MRFGMRLLLLAAFLAFAASYTWHQWRAIPPANTRQQHYDVILVLGCPSRKDGTPTPEQRARTLAGVRAWQQGTAPRLLLSGGPAHNRWVEADSMARIASQSGVPSSAILEERRAQNTVENIAYTVRIMQARGWHSAEVISSPSHLPRAGVILAHFPIVWRTEAAPWPPEFWPWQRWTREPEAAYCLCLRRFGFPRRQALLLPTVSTPPRLPSAQPIPQAASVPPSRPHAL